MRFAVLRFVLPVAAITAATEALNQKWDDFCAVWNPDERRAWRDAQRAETLDADQIERGGHGGYAAGCGSEEG